MQLENLKVAVAGSAIGGASVALLLANAGADVTVFERVPQPKAVGAGIALQPNGLAVLYGLGLKEKLVPRGCLLDSGRVADGRGRTLVAPTLPPSSEGLDKALMIRRSELFTVLLDAVAAQPRITTRFGTEVVGASRDGKIRVRHGESEEALEFDLVIGADGVRSKLRDCGDFGARAGGSGIWYVRGITPVNAAKQEEAWTSAGIFGSFPLPDATYFFSSAGTPALAKAVKDRDLAAFRATWAKAYPASVEILAPLKSFDELLLNEVIQVDCARFFDGRLALLGDAAHAMAPNLGQGANSALVDAAALVDELVKGTTLEEAIAKYDARRRPAVKKVQRAAAMGGALSEKTNGLVRFMRDRVLVPLGTSGMEKRLADVMQEPPERLLALTRGLVRAER